MAGHCHPAEQHNDDPAVNDESWVGNIGCVVPEMVEWLASSDGRAVLEFVTVVDDDAHLRASRGDASAVDALKLANAIAKHFPDLDRGLAAAALTQVQLRRKAAGRLGPHASELLYTRDGLEQASRLVVAQLRAGRYRDAGVESVADLGCGIGLDSIAFSLAGIAVTAIERDPTVATIARANAAAVGVSDRLTVVEADVTDPDTLALLLSRVDAIFLDPARRDTASQTSGRSQRTLDPQAWSPPWSWVAALAERSPRLAAKVAPGIPHELTPDGGCTTWTSVDCDLVEAEVAWPGLNTAGVRRRAVVIRRDVAHELSSAISLEAEPLAPIGTIGNWIMEPDDAVIRAGLIAALAERIDARFIDPQVAYLTSDDEPPPSPFMAAFRVDEALPYSLDSLRRALTARGVGQVVVKKRAITIDPDDVRKRLKLPKAEGKATVVITRIGTDPWAYICAPRARAIPDE